MTLNSDGEQAQPPASPDDTQSGDRTDTGPAGMGEDDPLEENEEGEISTDSTGGSETTEGSTESSIAESTLTPTVTEESQTTASETVPDEPRSAFAPLQGEPPADPRSYVSFHAYYIHYDHALASEKGPYQLSLIGDKKPTTQNVKYQLEFHNDIPLEAGEVEIKMPFFLYTDRQGQAVKPAAIGVPQAPQESQVSPFNYKVDSDENGEYLVFSNVRPISAGTNNNIQVLYCLDDMQTMDGSKWRLTPEVTVQGQELSDLTPLTGSMDTEVKLSAVEKRAYSDNHQYYPELYSWNQVLGVLHKSPAEYPQPEDFENYKYVLWQTRVELLASQPWSLTVTDTPALDGQVVGYVRYNEHPEVDRGYIDTQMGTTYTLNEQAFYGLSAQNANGYIYTVIRYPKEKIKAGETEIPNSIEVMVTGCDEPTPQTMFSTAKHVWEDYQWNYQGDQFAVEKTYDSRKEDTEIGYYSVLREKVAAGTDMELPRSWKLGAHILGYKLSQEGNDEYTVYLMDDLLYVKSNQDSYQRLGPEDYYYYQIHFELDEREIDKYEDQTQPVSDGKPVTIKVQTADQPGVWQLVDTVPFMGLSSYQIPDAWIGRGIYRIRVEHASSRYSCGLYISAKTVLRASSSEKLRTYAQDSKVNTLTLFNLDGGYYAGPDGNDHFFTLSSGALPPGVEDFDQETYGGNPLRAEATVTLNRVNGRNTLQKFVNTSQDPIHGRVNMDYVLLASEGYDIYSLGVDYLRSLGLYVGRKQIYFYDLLPLGMRFNPQVPVTVGSPDMYTLSKANSDSWNKEQYSVDCKIVDNYKGSGRQLLRFCLNYSGEDGSRISSGLVSREWYQSWGLRFGAFYSWNDYSIANEASNVAAFDTIDEMIGKSYKDDGTGLPPGTGTAPELLKDVDGNGEISDFDHLIYATAAHSDDLVLAAKSGIEKYVKADADRFMVPQKEASVEVGEGYTYTLQVRVNPDGSQAKDIVIFDHLEEALNDPQVQPGIEDETTSWKGSFAGVDLSQLKLKGIAPKVYYSDSESAPHDLDDRTWILSDQWTKELSEVKSLAIDIRQGQKGQDFILKNGQSISCGIHMIAPVTMPEDAYAFNLASFRSQQSTADGVFGDLQEVKSDPTKVSLFASSSLSIEKQLAVNTPENLRDDRFAFSVFLKGSPLVDKEYELSAGGKKLPGIHATNADGQLFLKAGQKARFPSLPAGAAYEVTELTGYQWKSDIGKMQSGTLEGDQENSLCYTNTYQPILYFEKRLKYAQDYTHSGDEFSFALKLNGQPAAGYEYYLFTAEEAKTQNTASPPDISGKTALLTDDEGQFHLTAGQRAAFALPPQSNYSVEEIAIPEGYNREVQRIVTGHLETENVLATLSNEYVYKDLFVKKTVQHAEGVDLPDESFTFELRLNDQPAAEAAYILYGTDPEQPGQIKEIERDKLSVEGRFMLKDGQEIRLIKLPKGASYEVREILTDEQQKTYHSSSENARGHLPSQAPFTKVAFNNRYRLKNLEVSKTVIAPTAADQLQDFSFVVTKNGEALANTTYRLFEGEMEVPGGPFSTDENGKLTLKHGRRALLPGFREGESYTVREEQVGGYTQIAPKDPKGIRGTVDPSLQNTKVAFSNINEANKDVLIFNKHLEIDESLSQYIRDNPLISSMGLEDLAQLKFTFQILVNDKPLEHTSYTRIDAEGSEHSETTLDLGHKQGCFTLKANETAIFKDIGEGRYKIQELFPTFMDHYYSFDLGQGHYLYGRWEVKEAPEAEAVEGLISHMGVNQTEMTNLLKYADEANFHYVILSKYVNDLSITDESVKLANKRIRFHVTFFNKDGQEVKIDKGLKWYTEAVPLFGYDLPPSPAAESDADGNIEIDFSQLRDYALLFYMGDYTVELEESLPPGHPAGELNWKTTTLWNDNINNRYYHYFYFYNTTQRDNLRVEKQVLNEEDADKSFGFTIERLQPVTLFIDDGYSGQIVFAPYAHASFIRYSARSETPVTGQPEMTDEQGRFTLRAGEYALFHVPVDASGLGADIARDGIDPRQRFRVTEEAYSDYASQITYHKEDGTEQTFSGNRVELMGKEKATFTNTYEETAGLSVSKTVTREEGQSAPTPDQEFRFKLEVGGQPWKNKTYCLYDQSGKEMENKTKIHGVDVIKPWTTDSLGQFSLKEGERAVFDWIGAGKNYELTELPAEGFVQTVPAEGQSLSGVIPQKGDVLGFTNMFKNPGRKGELIVQKLLQVPAGIAKYPKESFDFKVEIGGKAFDFRNYDLYSEDGKCLEKDRQTDSEGKFSLDGKQYAVFKDVPPNQDYKVSEIAKEGSLYQPLGENIQEGATTDSSTHLRFVNGLSSLWVSKAVTNHSKQKPDPNEAFSFMLTLGGEPAGERRYWLYDKDLKKMAEKSCAADGSFTLKADESAIFFGIPAGTPYELSEKPKEEFSQTLPAEGQGFSGKIDYSARKLFFVNNYAPLPGLWLSKQVIDKDSQPVADIREFSFKLSHEGQPLAWKNYWLYATDGSLKPQIHQTNQEGVLQLRAGEKAYLEGLQAGNYRAEEIDVPKAYSPIEKDKSLSLSSGGEDGYLSFVNKIDLPEKIYGHLIITNTVRPSVDKPRFHYILKLSDKDIQGLQGTLYEGGLKGAGVLPAVADATALGQIAFVDGKAEFDLSDSQWVELKGLLAGTDYEIHEIENKDYRTTVQGQPGFSWKGDIVANQTVQVDYVNERVAPPSPEEDPFRPFKPVIVKPACPSPLPINQTTAIPGKCLYRLPRTGEGQNFAWSSLLGAMLLLLGLSALKRRH